MQLTINLPDNIFFGINQTEQSLSEMLKEKLALELYKSSQISITQGAKIVGLDMYEFMTLLKKNKIEVIEDYDIEDEVLLSKEEIAKVVENSQRIEGYEPVSKAYELEVEAFMRENGLEISA